MLAHCQLNWSAHYYHTNWCPQSTVQNVKSHLFSWDWELRNRFNYIQRIFKQLYIGHSLVHGARATVGRSENNLDILRVFQNPGSCSVLNVWRYCQYPLDVNSTKHDGIKPLTDQSYEFHTDVYEIWCNLQVPYLCMITSAFIFKFKNNEVSIMFCVLYFFFLSIYITGSICI